MNVSMKELIKNLLSTPRVIETGTSGIWTWRKWSDGTAECWGLHTGTYQLTLNYGGAYYDTATISFPTGLFISEPKLEALRQGREGVGLVSISPYSVTADSISTFIFNTGAAYQDAPLGFSFYAIGKWK